MNEKEYNNLKSTSEMSSLTYTSYESMMNFKMITEDKNTYFYGFDHDLGLHILHYHVFDQEKFYAYLRQLDETVLLSFVSETMKSELLQLGFEDYVYWKDYRSGSIKSYKSPLHEINGSQYKEASEVTLSCHTQTRGFTGQSPEWIKEWVEGNNMGLLNSKATSSTVLVEGSPMKGIACVAIYNNTLWIREIVVKPEYQGQGYGKRLMEQAMTYGVSHHAKKGFLMADSLNETGHHLYHKYGFIEEDDGQLDMIKIKKEVSLTHYLGKEVNVVMDRRMYETHPKFDMIYPINYGYLPHTKSGDNHEVDAYVLGPSGPVDTFSGQVIAIVHRNDDQEEKLVVADKLYSKTMIEKSIEFTERYFKSHLTLLEKI